MKLAVVLLLVALTACHASQPTTYGVIGDIKGFVEKVFNRETAIQVKVQEVITKISDVIKDTKSWYDDLKAETHPQRPAEYYIEQIYNKIVEKVTEIVNGVVDSILALYERVSNAINEKLGGNTIGRAVYEFLDDLVGGYIRLILEGVRKALDFLNFLDDYDWTDLIDRVMQSVEDSVNERVEAAKDRVQDKFRPKPVTYGFLQDTKDFVEKVIKRETAIQIKIQEVISKLTSLVEETKSWYDDMKAETHPQRPAEYYIEQLYNRIVEKVVEIVNSVVDSILAVFETVMNKVTEFLEGMLGGSTIGKAIFKFIDEMLRKYVSLLLDAVRKALDSLSSIDDYDWSPLVDRIVDQVEQSINTKLDEFRQRVGNKGPGRSTYGMASGIQDFFQKIIQKETWLQVQLRELSDKVTGFVSDFKSWREQLRSETAPELPLEHHAKELEKKVLDYVTSTISVVFDEVVGAFRTVIDAVDSVFNKIFLGESLKSKIYEWLDDALGGMIESAVSVVRSVMDLLNKIEGLDWDGFIEHTTETLRNMLDEKVADLRQGLRDKVGKKVGEVLN